MANVILTTEQDKAIKNLFKNKWSHKDILEVQKIGWSQISAKCLNTLSVEEMKIALYEPQNIMIFDKGPVTGGFVTGVGKDVGKLEPKEGCSEMSFKEWAERKIENREQAHLNNPFYKRVDEVTAEVATGQILKGSEKYEEPFTPSSWTGSELVNHALQELRDGQVYVVGMMEKFEELESENERLQKEKERLKEENRDLNQNANYWKELFELSKDAIELARKENEALREWCSKHQ